MILLKVKMLKVLKILIRIFSLLLYLLSFISQDGGGEGNCYRVWKDQGKTKGLLFACMHYRAHPRHYRAEYVRGYLHRKRCV